MKLTKSNSKPKFTSGISYEEHRSRAAEIYEKTVKPQIVARKNNGSQANKLNDDQKAHLSCNSPI